MANYKITDLPVHPPETGDIIEIAVANHDGIIHRVDKLNATFHTEDEAIKRIKEIFSSGLKVFILPYKND